MGAFAGMRDAKMYETGTPLTVGVFAVEINKCILKNTRKSGLAFIAEMTVIETSDPAKHPAGSKRSWFQKMADLDVAHGSLKTFAAAILGFDPRSQKEEVKAKLDPEIEAIMDAACDEHQVFAGKKVRVECTLTKTKEKKIDFTRHDWSPFVKAA